MKKDIETGNSTLAVKTRGRPRNIDKDKTAKETPRKTSKPKTPKGQSTKAIRKKNPKPLYKPNPVGRPSKYKPELCQDIIRFFTDENVKPLPSFEKYAFLLGINTDTLYAWKEAHPEFSEACKTATEIYRQRWIDSTLNSEVNTAFSIFMGKNIFKWSDRQEYDRNDAVTIQIMTYQGDNGHPIAIDITPKVDQKQLLPPTGDNESGAAAHFKGKKQG